MPFSARAGRDLNNDGATTNCINLEPRGIRVTVRWIWRAVNAWRAVNGLGPITATQIDTNNYNSVDLRLSKSFAPAPHARRSSWWVRSSTCSARPISGIGGSGRLGGQRAVGLLRTDSDGVQPSTG